MTTKKEEDKPVNSRRKKKSEPKRLLIELIQSSKVKPSVIAYKLTGAGLYKQYEYEKKIYRKLDLQPTITESEFKKIIGE